MQKELLKGKVGLIMGVANEKSIAYSISQQAFNSGAKLIFSYPNDAMKKRVEPIAKSFESEDVLECDVVNQDSIDEMFSKIEKKYGKIDFIVHSVAFSDKNELKGMYVDTSRDNFLNTMNISCFSLVAVAKKYSILKEGGSIMTLSYLGAERVIPNYNVMGVAKAALECSVRYLASDLGKFGIRVNSISAGPIKTLAASGISDFKMVLSYTENNAPLRRNVTIDDVGKTALYLLSDMSSGVTGENIHVDAGYSTIGMPDANNIS